MIDLSWLYDLVGRAVPLECMQQRFMQQALIALVLLAPMAAALGVQVINFRMAFFSDAISHSAFAGLALGLILSLDVRLAMVGFAVLIGLGIIAVGRRTSLSMDAVIGVFFSAAIAFGLAIVKREPSLSRDIQKYLFGDILTISDVEIVSLAGLFLVLMVFQAVGYNRMLYVGLNAALAAAHRIRTRIYQYIFAALLSVVAIFSVWTVGVFLVTAMLVVPAAAGRNFARSAGGMFWWALLIAVSSAVAGLLISAQPWARTATGATVVLCATAWFVISLLPRLWRRS
ncbi:MAG: metal ABC transporter permease [Planctomycetaceae bacterium]|nr:metal ABC transporter permease [Planctomycetaceae bacterium]